jgi:2-dehydro-3-deoxygalactonokinase
MESPDWIAIDWGTSRLRAWAMGEDGGVLGRAESDDGMAAMETADDYEPALLALVEPWLDPGRKLPVIGCGMVGSRQGWIEVPYAEAPCRPLDIPVGAPVRDDRIEMRICPGVMQGDPADVMRGEETQIAGLLAREPEFDGAVCLPGTHSKWVRVRGGRIESFTTFLTGELFELLARQSVLRHSVGGEGWDEEAFREGVTAGRERPGDLSARLFELRAEPLLRGTGGEVTRSRLSGFLIGWELGGASNFWSGNQVTMLGSGELASRYVEALGFLGSEARMPDCERLTLAGLGEARKFIA